MSLGKGVIYGKSTTQKLNTRSSTEAELVGVVDCMPQVMWTKFFLEAQGYNNMENVIYQYNQSMMLLAINDRASGSQRMRHINIRDYVVTDRIKEGNIKVKYCPTNLMIGDFFTKPLQGCKFKQFRD